MTSEEIERMAVAMEVSMAAAFNEWMRRYTTHPEEFDREWEAVNEYLSQRNAGEQPSYGASCARYLLSLLDEGAGSVSNG